GELADAVREGRRGEFADFAEFADAETRARIPDPNAPETFEASRPDFTSATEPGHAEWLALYRTLLQIRHAQIIPRLPGSRFFGSAALGKSVVLARWKLGDGSTLRLELNLGTAAVPITAPRGNARLLFASRDQSELLVADQLPAATAAIYLEDAQ